MYKLSNHTLCHVIKSFNSADSFLVIGQDLHVRSFSIINCAYITDNFTQIKNTRAISTLPGCRAVEDVGAYEPQLLAMYCHVQKLLRCHSAPNHLLRHVYVLLPCPSSACSAENSVRQHQVLKIVCSHYMSKKRHLSFPHHYQQLFPTSNSLKNVHITLTLCPTNFEPPPLSCLQDPFYKFLFSSVIGGVCVFVCVHRGSRVHRCVEQRYSCVDEQDFYNSGKALAAGFL